MTDTVTYSRPTPAPLVAHGADPLSGRFVTPGDNAIALRALLLGALTVGRTTITGLRPSHDGSMLIEALRALGVSVETPGDDVWQVHGLGPAGLLEPQAPLQRGHAASIAPLLLGLLAPYNFVTRLAAGPPLDAASLAALTAGLGAVGARLEQQSDGSMTLHGACLPLAPRQAFGAPDELLKTALLLAGLQLAGQTLLHEAVPSRDHTEKLLAAFGAAITVTPDSDGSEGVSIALEGLPELQPQRIGIPGDPSAAAFAIVAALVVKGSDILIENVLINPLRTGLIDTLLGMGGDIQFLNQREAAGEHTADLRVRSSWLKGIAVDARHTGMLEDIVALAIAAAYAQGETVISGLGEMGDRLEALAVGLGANKVAVSFSADSLTIDGDGKVPGGAQIDSQNDAAIAMGFAVLGLASRQRVTIVDARAMADSFPGFVAAMTAAGGHLALNGDTST